MSKVGYVINYAGYGTDVDKEWMKRFGCTEIMEEKQECGPLRAEWNKLLRRLNKGDELVVPKLSYIIRETRQLSYLLEYCRLKEIRLISIHDCIDSGNELFQRHRCRIYSMSWHCCPKKHLMSANPLMQSER